MGLGFDPQLLLGPVSNDYPLISRQQSYMYITLCTDFVKIEWMSLKLI